MKLAVISFTEKGNQVNEELTRKFRELGEQCTGYVMGRFMDAGNGLAGLMPVDISLNEWVGNQFAAVAGIIFIGAAGIAVRAIAPYVKDKMTDPAVVVMDEKKQFSISLLSGHVGGANELALTVSRIMGTVPVITTATDVNGRFAVDVFAQERNLVIGERDVAKRISSDVLEGRPVGFFSDFPVEGELPEGLSREKICSRNIWITGKNRVEVDTFANRNANTGAEVLRLIPKLLVAGLGCRRGTAVEDIRGAVHQALLAAGRSASAVFVIASIDLKREEQGLISCAEELGVEFHTYSSVELGEVPGNYTESVFVAEITGVGNVCERAAMREVMNAGGGCLILGKQVFRGVTVALAEKNWKVVL